MEAGKAYEPPRFCIEVNVARGGWEIAVLRLHHGECVVESILDEG